MSCLFPVWSADCVSLSPPVGSKSDGQKSPSDSVFLRMDDIPYIRENREERKEGTGGWIEGWVLKQNHDNIIMHQYTVITSWSPKIKATKKWNQTKSPDQQFVPNATHLEQIAGQVNINHCHYFINNFQILNE